MAELLRGERRTTIRPVSPVGARGVQAVADGFNDLARQASSVMGQAEQEIENDRQLFEQTTMAKLENDAWTEIGRLTREFSGKPETVGSAFGAWAKERLKGLDSVLSEDSRRRLPLWEQRLMGIGGRAVAQQHEVARGIQDNESKAAFAQLHTTVKEALRVEIEALALVDGEPDILALTEGHAQVLREDAFGLQQRGLVTSTEVLHVGVNLNKWAYKWWATKRAGHLAISQGQDAANAFVDGLDDTKTAFTLEELKAVKDLAASEARNVSAIGAEQRDIELVKYDARMRMARTMDEVAAIPVPGNLTEPQRVRALAARAVALNNLQIERVEKTEQGLADHLGGMIEDAVTLGDPSQMPDDGAINLMREDLAVKLHRLKQRGLIRMQAAQARNEAIANAKAADAHKTAMRQAQVATWIQNIQAGTGEGVPDVSRVIEMLGSGDITRADASQLISAHNARTESRARLENARTILETRARAITGTDKRDINALADDLFKAGQMDVTNPAQLAQIADFAASAGMVPNAVKEQFRNHGDRTYEEVVAMHRAGFELARYGLWNDREREQAAWLEIGDAIRARLPTQDVMAIVRKSVVPEDPGTREIKERELTILKSSDDLILAAATNRLEAGLADATWISRITRGLFTGAAPAFPTVTLTADGWNWSFGLGSQPVDVDPKLITNARIAATAVSAAAPSPLVASRLAEGGVDRIMPRVGVSSVTRPIGRSHYALTIDPPELHFPEASGRTEMVLAAVGQQAIQSMRQNQLSDPNRSMSFTTLDGVTVTEADLAKPDGLSAVSKLVKDKLMWVEPVATGSDGRPRYAIVVQPDGDGPPQRLVHVFADGRQENAIPFDNARVAFARERFDALGTIPQLRNWARDLVSGSK